MEYDIGGGTVPKFMIVKEDSFSNLKNLDEFKKSTVNEGIGDYRRNVERKIIYLQADKDRIIELKTE